MPLDIHWPRITHELRFNDDGRTSRKVLRAEILIGQHRFFEEVLDDDSAWPELRRRAEALRVQLEQLPR